MGRPLTTAFPALGEPYDWIVHKTGMGGCVQLPVVSRLENEFGVGMSEAADNLQG